MAGYDPDDDRRFKELAATMRTDSGLPICFNCERVGHTKKVCRVPRKKGTKFEEKFEDRVNNRETERNFQDRGMNRNFQDRGPNRNFQDRSFLQKSYPERSNFLDRSRDRSPISRPSRFFAERDSRAPYRRPSPPPFRRSSESFLQRRLEVTEAEVRCERLEDHLRKLQDEIIDLRAEARTTRMVPSRPMHEMHMSNREEYEEEVPIPGVVKQLAKLLRTDDDQPICFECGRPGHTRRYCYLNN